VDRRRVVAGAIGLVVASGIVLRFVTRSDLWLDEALTVDIARLPLRDIGPWLKHDGAPPLFYWLLHGWMAAFGTGDVAARSLSGVFGVLSLPLAWWCGKRSGDARTAWLAVVVLAVNPFAIRYATEARMYGLEILVVFGGILAVRRALERPSGARLLLVVLLAAALAWTHYWALGLLAATVAVLALAAWRATDAATRRAALLAAAAVAVGTATLVAWAATLRYQKAHTGTPWIAPSAPPGPFALSILDFAGGDHPEGYLLVYPAVLIAVLGAFGVAARGFVVELDARARTSVRWEALTGALGLGLAATIAWAGHSGFQPRYAAIALPFFVLLLARGIALLDDARLRAGAVALVVACGVVGGVRNVAENRTQTGDVAAAIRTRARSGDVVVYCPDQLGPATHRLLRRRDLVELKYPLDPRADPRVGLVDWVDYVARLDANPPDLAARRVLARAGAHAIYVVTSPGYITHDARCPVFVQDLVALGHRRATPLVAPNATIFEHAGLEVLAP
jgi:mannosyltransferase